jgi:hypothetical protein
LCILGVIKPIIVNFFRIYVLCMYRGCCILSVIRWNPFLIYYHHHHCKVYFGRLVWGGTRIDFYIWHKVHWDTLFIYTCIYTYIYIYIYIYIYEHAFLAGSVIVISCGLVNTVTEMENILKLFCCNLLEVNIIIIQCTLIIDILLNFIYVYMCIYV